MIFPEYKITSGVTVEDPEGLFVRGSVMRGIVADRTSPIAYGYDAQVPVYFSQSPVLSAGGGGGGFGGGRGGDGGHSRRRDEHHADGESAATAVARTIRRTAGAATPRRRRGGPRRARRRWWRTGRRPRRSWRVRWVRRRRMPSGRA